jgi:hypothetical protein
MRRHPAHDLSRTYRCVSILLGRAALRAIQHLHLHARADARSRFRFWYQRGRRDLFNNRVLLLHHPPRDFVRICRRVLILSGALLLNNMSTSVFTGYEGPRDGPPPAALWHIPPGNPDGTLDRLSWDRSAEAFAPPNALIDCLGLCEIGCAGISGPAPGENATPPRAERSLGGAGGTHCVSEEMEDGTKFV